MTRMISLAGLMTAISFGAAFAVEEVNIYSYRQPALIKPLLEAFSADTGIRTNIVFAEKGLIERAEAEGRNSPADIILTTDIGRLAGAKTAGISQAVSSPTLEANIPPQYRDTDGHWFGLTTRARVIYASRERVTQETITYEELADPRWRGRICTRSGQHAYTIGLVAAMIAHLGTEKATEWLNGLRQNLARRPAGNDRSQVKAVYAGECDLALGNTYYMGTMETNTEQPEQQRWAKAVRILFPNSGERGTHVNLSGMLMAKHAPHRENALKLMEFLSSTEAQRIYAQVNFEYPVRSDVPVSDRVASWGSFTADTLSLGEVARHRKQASELVDQVGFDDGPSS